jgi:riboflavin biosynthesis pyrimidine reductase
MFHGLRESVDAVMAGTGTLRSETYGRILGRPERRRRRAQRGLSPEPVAVIVSRSGDVPLDLPLLDEPEARVLLFTPVPITAPRWRAQVDMVALEPGELTLTTVLRHLRSERGIRSLLCEGGPTLFGVLLQEGLADELFLTLAPKLAGGGTSPTIASGPELAEPDRLSLKWVLERQGSLFLRYEVG